MRIINKLCSQGHENGSFGVGVCGAMSGKWYEGSGEASKIIFLDLGASDGLKILPNHP